jgi:ribulose-phosphate 3-epimerase
MKSISLLNLDELDYKAVDKLNADYLHVDVMDGSFVSNTKNYDLDKLKQLKTALDVHLMVDDIESYSMLYDSLDSEYITFHIEATHNPKKMIRVVKETGSKVGISINPNTPIGVIKPYLKYVNLVLVMSVTPGMGGQTFNKLVISKVEELKTLRETNDYHYLIEVDGGINPETIKEIDADIYVVGSYITKSKDFQKSYYELKEVTK